MTRTILTVAAELDMSAIAEGVETESELAALADLGCPHAQGYLFSRPVAPAVLAELFVAVNHDYPVPAVATVRPKAAVPSPGS